MTADGVVRTASREEHPDLFWAARGGGRGLGVVTSFEFDLHPLGPVVRKAQVLYPYDQARTVARGWRDLTATLPDTVSPELVLWSIPPNPAIPARLHGAPVVIVAGVYAGDPGDAAPVLAPLAELGTPLMQGGGDVRYTDVQQALDPAFPPGGRYYFKSHFVRELSDDAIDTMIECDARRATPQSLMVIRTLGGAIDRVDADANACLGAARLAKQADSPRWEPNACLGGCTPREAGGQAPVGAQRLRGPGTT